jgi:hypothetical protein
MSLLWKGYNLNTNKCDSCICDSCSCTPLVLKENLKNYLGGKDMLTGYLRSIMMKQCKQCKKEFEPKDEFDLFCSQECKEEALAELDSDSDECLSCQ